MPRKPKREEAVNFDAQGFVLSVSLLPDAERNMEKYPFSIPAVRHLNTLDLDPKVTFFVGENGSGKSTLMEAIAVAVGFNAEGGSKNFTFETRRTESALYDALRIKRGVRRETDGFFLRAESLYNVASNIEDLGICLTEYGGKSLHAQSHGEAFLSLAMHRFRGNGLYILDEPEAALSPTRQLALLHVIHGQVQRKRSQFLIATHSPILMAYPSARIYNLTETGISTIAYEETEHYRITCSFLNNRDKYLRDLAGDSDPE